MMRCFCDACGSEVMTDTESRYTLKLDMREVCDPEDELAEVDLLGQSDDDHLDAVAELLEAETEHHSLPDTSSSTERSIRVYDLCSGCAAKFIADPFGQQRQRTRRFSSN